MDNRPPKPRVVAPAGRRRRKGLIGRVVAALCLPFVCLLIAIRPDLFDEDSD
ncbi:hypothetical protein NCHU2750_24040 [Neorhizobium sp. NCHU2750]|nr:hypothetical protein NCHU2750_24040 [Neorhizobium sp. NCHU2750]